MLSVTHQVHVLDAVRAGDHARDQRSDLEVGVGAGRPGHGDVLGNQVCQTGLVGQCHDRDQARRADQVRVIENGGDVVADSHYRVLLLSGRSELSQVPSSQVTGAFVRYDPAWSPITSADRGSARGPGCPLYHQSEGSESGDLV